MQRDEIATGAEPVVTNGATYGSKAENSNFMRIFRHFQKLSKLYFLLEYHMNHLHKNIRIFCSHNNKMFVGEFLSSPLHVDIEICIISLH